MKSPLRKLKGFAKKDHRHHHRSPAKLDELVQATQDMVDMRSCYDSLLSAAAATANSAYEFSEALEEMGTCLLEKTALNEDEDSGRVLLMLGKVQFELQKLMDSYRAHILQTIRTPSESLLKELQTVEEMKQQCDEKRDSYKQMVIAHKEKGRSKHAKGESVSSQRLQEAQDDYEAEADLFIFRLKSLKQGQSRSLLTQSARHHAAQLNFFRKGLKSLEAVETHVKIVADREHIDYQFSGLDDDDSEDCDYYSYDDNDDGELSFDYGQNDNDDASSSTNSMELDPVDQSMNRASISESTKENVERRHDESFRFNRRTNAGSQSAPIFPDMKFDPAEKVKVLRPSSTKKFPTYVLPTPLDARRTVSTGCVSPVSIPGLDRRGSGAPTQLWHSSPLEPYKFPKNSREDALSSPTKFPKSQTSVLKESNINGGPIRAPPPLNAEPSMPHFNPHTGSDPKKIKRLAFSGPISSVHWLNSPNVSATDFTPSVKHPRASSVLPAHVLTSRSSISPKAPLNISPPPMKSPKICELHELPRPPIGGFQRSTRPTSLIGHSAPLVYRGPELNKTSKASQNTSQTASPLPTPPAAVQRSFSIPSRRMPVSPVAKFLKEPNNTDSSEDFASPPLTPITLMNTRPASQASERVARATRAKGNKQLLSNDIYPCIMSKLS